MRDFVAWEHSPICYGVNNCIGTWRTCLVLQTSKLASGVYDAAVGINKAFKPGNSSEQLPLFSLWYLPMTVNTFIDFGMPTGT